MSRQVLSSKQIKALKRDAKRRSRQFGVPHRQALDESARGAGYSDWRALATTSARHAGSDETLGGVERTSEATRPAMPPAVDVVNILLSAGLVEMTPDAIRHWITSSTR